MIRLDWIDGLKGVAGVAVVIFHYLLAFAPWGFIGWECGIGPNLLTATYWQYFPYSLLTNSPLALGLFLGIIGFIPAYQVFKRGTLDTIQKQATMRYFRFVLPILVMTLLSWAMGALGAFDFPEVSTVTGSPWYLAILPHEISWQSAIYDGLWGAIAYGNQTYNSVLWVMPIILIGSYLSFATIAGFAFLKRRYLAYLVILALTVSLPIYWFFIAGVIAADIVAHSQRSLSTGLATGGGLLGVAIAHVPAFLLPSEVGESMVVAVSLLLIYVSCGMSDFYQKSLSHPILVYLGKRSFSLILTHFLVIMSVSAWSFVSMSQRGIHPAMTLAVVGISAIPINLALSELFYRLVESPSQRLTNRLWQWFSR